MTQKEFDKLKIGDVVRVVTIRGSCMSACLGAKVPAMICSGCRLSKPGSSSIITKKWRYNIALRFAKCGARFAAMHVERDRDWRRI